jgi:hypothetical protein
MKHLTPGDMAYQDKINGLYCGTCQNGTCLVEDGTYCCHNAVRGLSCPHQPSNGFLSHKEFAFAEKDDIDRNYGDGFDYGEYAKRARRSTQPSSRPQRPHLKQEAAEE